MKTNKRLFILILHRLSLTQKIVTCQAGYSNKFYAAKLVVYSSKNKKTQINCV